MLITRKVSSHMFIQRSALFLVFMITLLVGGCAGTRESYQSLLDDTTSSPTIYMSVGETKEVLTIGDGFPGWWGYYPALLIQSPDIASVYCRQEHSLVSFREPGVIFGGSVCYLTAHKAGETLAIYGNQFTLALRMKETQFPDNDSWINIIVTE